MKGFKNLAKLTLLIILAVFDFAFFIFLTLLSFKWLGFWGPLVSLSFVFLIGIIYFYRQNKPIPLFGLLAHRAYREFFKRQEKNKIYLFKNHYGQKEMVIDMNYWRKLDQFYWLVARKAILIFGSADEMVKIVFESSRPLGLVPGKNFQRLYSFEKIKEEYFNEYLIATKIKQKKARILSVASFGATIAFMMIVINLFQI